MSKPLLKLDWCSHEAAKYAVEHWHYSRTMPAGKMVKVGVWEDEKYIGCVLFSRGANNHIGSPYALKQTEVCELTRIALSSHETPVSRIMSIAIKMLVKQSTGIRLLISYADPEHQHVGGVYQAMNWLYVGSSGAQRFTLRSDGTIMHKRTAHSLYGTVKGLDYSKELWKHKYLYPLDDAMRKQIAPLAKPYPKRVPSADSGTSSDQLEGGGATPTGTLSD